MFTCWWLDQQIRLEASIITSKKHTQRQKYLTQVIKFKYGKLANNKKV